MKDLIIHALDVDISMYQTVFVLWFNKSQFITIRNVVNASIYAMPLMICGY